MNDQSTLKGEFSGLSRIRMGDCRIVYEVQDKKLVILVVRVARMRGRKKGGRGKLSCA